MLDHSDSHSDRIDTNAPLGIIAGSGDLPLMVVEGAKALGRPVYGVGLRGFFDPRLPEGCERFTTAGAAQIGRWSRVFRGWGVQETIMVGAVNKNVMYGMFGTLKLLPDCLLYTSDAADD